VTTLLASMEDFAHSRGATFDSTDMQAMIALEGASGVVRAYCNRTFDYLEDEEVTLTPHGTAGLLLPEIPVHEVSEVTLVASDATETALETTDWFLDGATGILYRISSTGTYPWYWGWNWYSNPVTTRVRVTYTHGYVLPGEPVIEGVPDLPAEISLVVMQIAARNLIYSAQGGQLVRSKSLGSYSVTYETSTSESDASSPEKAERAVLEKYRLRNAV
jgi:hypothetical protein